jgi:aminoglycoside phosphotransferase
VAGDEARAVGGEEGNRAGDILRLADPVERDAAHEARGERRRVEARVAQHRGHRLGHRLRRLDRVDPDPVRCPLDRQLARELDEARFGDAVDEIPASPARNSPRSS